MDYATHYDKLVARAMGRVLCGYKERHHIVPKCIGGDNSRSNMVCFTAEEHYVAHQLLCKMYPEHAGLAYAAVKMAKKATGRRAYAWLRKKMANGLSKLYAGKKLPQETRNKLSAALMGHVGYWTGKTRSAEANLRTSESLRGIKKSLDTRKRMSEASKKRGFPVQARLAHAAMSAEKRSANVLKAWISRRANSAFRGNA